MEALKTLPGLRVSEVNDRAQFMALEGEWNALVARVNDQVFYRHEFFRIWIDNFAPKAKLRVLVGRNDRGELSAVLPLIEQRSSLYGIPVTELSSAGNAHSCRFDLIAEAGETARSAGEAFMDHLRADKSWDVIRIIDVPEAGGAFWLADAAKQRGNPIGSWESLNSPYFALPSSFDAFSAGLQSKFKANCRRRRKKLEEKGAVSFERYDGGAELDAKLEEGFGLEASGWKGERGTAIAQDKATRGFYTELAREASARGWLSLYFHRLSGKAVSFHYGLSYGGKYLLLKPGYDETLKECSPGQLLMEDVVRDCIDRKQSEFDFLGPDMPWKRDWTDKARQHTWLFIFRDSAFGKTLCAAKFKWAPVAKEAMAKWRK
ncbi:MAG: GNAT family N-acetyltransferase [Myxococcaceae bacterium]